MLSSNIKSLYPYNPQYTLSPTFATKEIIHNNLARQEILSGMTKLTDTLTATLGPKGRNVLIDQQYGEPKVTKNGISIIKELEFSNKFQNLGVSLIKEIAKKVENETGDGTTTAAILSKQIFQEGWKHIQSGVSPIKLRHGLDKSLEIVINYLQAKSIKITNQTDLQKVATVAANGDKEIGGIISKILTQIGIDGAINVQNGSKLHHEIEISEGIQFNRGHLSPYFITNQKLQRCELNKPYIFLHEKKWTDVKEIQRLLEFIKKENKPWWIICEDCENDVWAMLIINKLKANLQVCVVKSPSFGETRRHTLHDYAIATGGKVISDDSGDNMSQMQRPVDYLGKANQVIVTKDDTIIIKGGGDKMKWTERINLIKEQLSREETWYEKEKYLTRLNRWTGGIALFKVGGINETEVEEVKGKVNDSINSAKAAMKEGILPGGGIALLNARKSLDTVRFENYEEMCGLNIMKKILTTPTKLICDNAGINGDLMVSELWKNGEDGTGIDVMKGVKCNMVENGIIDPTRVVKEVIEKSVKLASLMLMTEVAIVEDVDNNSKEDSRSNS